jgi:hypothetical protein
LAFAHAATRASLGGAMLFAPRLSARPWLGEAVERGGGRVAMQAFAVRDLALGLGMLRALSRGEPVRHWFRLGVAFELVDAGATVLNRRELPDGPIPDAIAVLGAFGLGGGPVVGALLDERRGSATG